MSGKSNVSNTSTSDYQNSSSNAATLPKAPAAKPKTAPLGSGFVAQLRPTSPAQDYSYIPMGAFAEGVYTEF